MGWTSWNNEPRSTDEVLRDAFGSHEILASACKGGAWYAALRPQGKSYVTALVVLYKRGGGFAYKDMDESMGPSEARCPKSILALLSPLSEIEMPDVCREWAAMWRNRCLQQAEG